MIVPFQQDDALLADIRRADASAEVLHAWWLGQSGFLIAWNGFHLLIDPYLSDSLTAKYANTDKPHGRMTERVIAPERLDFIDVVTSSHNHTDHLDAETLCPIIAANPAIRLIIPEANRDFVAQRLGCAPHWPIGLDAGQQRDLPPMTVVGIPAAHEAIDRDAQGRCVYLGFVFHLGPFAIYHSGDTVHFEGMERLIRPHAIDLALLPINGALPERRVSGNLDGAEAARLANAIDAGVVVPCHYEMFAFNTASPTLFEDACRSLGQAFRTLRAGERISLRMH